MARKLRFLVLDFMARAKNMKAKNCSLFAGWILSLVLILSLPSLALAWDFGTNSEESSSSLSVVPAPESAEPVPRDPASNTSRGAVRPSTLLQPLSEGPKSLKDESELQVQTQLFVPDRKTSRERKVMNLDSKSEEE